ncbi:hypothetical protein V5279_23925 [Bradyrhizobium sp. 26S5]|uniref:hypothetical protein n=1 Tax=Bradyrhizobium sp. 26S5 TaxID=3139729 RepID=UPI0030D41DFF
MATPEAVALVLLSVLVTDNLSEVDERIATWAALRATKWDEKTSHFKVTTCALTHQRTLDKAIAHVIAKSFREGTVAFGISVHRNSMTATITDASRQLPSHFGHPKVDQYGIQLSASFSLSNISTLGAMLDGDGS